MALDHDAFISYSHAADRPVADALERGLQRLARPLFALRAMDVFRDVSSLSASPGLWTGIEAHLERSRWLVFVACPEAAGSVWCNREVEAWLARQGADRVLLALTAGDLVWPPGAADFDWTRTTALPPAMHGAFREEPLFVDLRWTRQAANLRAGDPRLRDAVLDLAAPIRGVPKDQLDGDDVRQLRRTKRLTRAAVALIIAAAGVAVWQAVEATRQRTVAERQRDLALSRQLAAQTGDLLLRDPRLALGLAVQALATADTVEAATSVLRAVNAAPFDLLVDQGESYWSLAVSDDGTAAVVGDGSSGVQRVELASGRIDRLPPAAVPRGTAGTLAVAVARDGRVASGGFDQTITLRQDGRIVRTIEGVHEGFIMGLAFSPAGNRLASAGSDGRVVLHDLTTGTATRVKDGWTPEATVVRFSPDGVTLAAGGDGGFRALYDVRGPVPRTAGAGLAREPESSASAVVEMRFTDDGRRLVVAHRDGIVDVLALPDGRRIARVRPDTTGELESMAISPDASRIVLGWSDGRVVVWTGDPPYYSSPWRPSVAHRHGSAVKGLAYLARTDRIVSIGVDGRLAVSRPLHLGALARTVWERAEPHTAVRFDRETGWTAFESPTGPVVVDAAGRVQEGVAPAAAVPEVLATRAGRTARRHEDGSLVLLDGQHRLSLQPPGGSPAMAAEFAPDGLRLYTFHGDGHLRAWNATDGAREGEAAIVEQPFLHHLAISPDGTTAAVSIDPGLDFGASGRRSPVTTIALVDARTLSVRPGRLEALPGPAGFGTTPLFFAPEEPLLGFLTGGGLTLWQLPSGRRIDELLVLPAYARALGVVGGPDRLLLATSGRSGRGAGLAAVALSPWAWAAQACRLAGGLSQDDWNRYLGTEFAYRPACVDGVLARGASPAAP